MHRLLEHLERIYDAEAAQDTFAKIQSIAGSYRYAQQPTPPRQCDQTHNLLITYGDTLNAPGEMPLQTLHRFCKKELDGAITGIHLLPFFPYSSDDGFSVIDYRQINRELGDWNHIQALSEDFDLMFDLPLNHCSRQNLWFSDYIADRPPANGYFIEVEPGTNLSMVTRPRNTPLTFEIPTHRGNKHIWCTFSEDQVDLDFTNPNVLLEFIDIIFLHIGHGAKLIRLDAIAYIWKNIGSTCIHQPETHEIVKLLHDLVSIYAPDVLLITETNVPHKENLSYLGDQDEAHGVYQFALPPLVLHGLLSENTRYLTDWAKELPQLTDGRFFFNFLASHDGVGVRPVENILPGSEMGKLLDAVHERGGFVSSKSNPDGTESPYELNISYFSALADDNPEVQIRRIIAAYGVCLSLAGVPGIYIHSLFGTPNDIAGVEHSGRVRSINRRRWDLAELESHLSDPQSDYAKVFAGLKHLLTLRQQLPSFHPAARQTVLDLDSKCFAMKRGEGDDELLVLINFSEPHIRVSTTDLDGNYFDHVSGKAMEISGGIAVGPHQVLWLNRMST